jgi:hypothetical protein
MITQGIMGEAASPPGRGVTPLPNAELPGKTDQRLATYFAGARASRLGRDPWRGTTYLAGCPERREFVRRHPL